MRRNENNNNNNNNINISNNNNDNNIHNNFPEFSGAIITIKKKTVDRR